MDRKDTPSGSIIFLDNQGIPIHSPQVYKTGNNKRTVVEHERDLEFIADLYLKGYSQMDILERLNSERHYQLSRTQIYKDIQTIHKRWIEHSIDFFEQRKLIECEKLDHVEHEMWNLYERSQQKKIVDESIIISGQNVGDESDPSGQVIKGQVVASGVGSQRKSKGFSRIKNTRREETNIGDLEILKEIRVTIMERSKLLGLITTKSSVNINWRKEAEAEGIDPEKFVIDATERILDAARLERGSIFGSLESGEEDSEPE